MTFLSGLFMILPAVLAFGAVFLTVLAGGRFIREVRASRRLGGLVAPRTGSASSASLRRDKTGTRLARPRLAGVLESLSRLSVPSEGWQNGGVRRKFVQAGFRADNVTHLYFAIKTVLSLAVPAIVGLAVYALAPAMQLPKIALIILALAAVGYYAPDQYLRWRTSRRVSEMRDVLPDLIDLLVISTEAGLAFDQALARVSREIGRSNRTIAEEFHLVILEIRAGAGRAEALRNLCARVELDDLNSLVSMLIQADRFGTSMGEALRIQSEVMRVKRMQRAEEVAAKVPTKMLLPLVFLVFPSLMFVLMGPAVIQLSSVLDKQ